MNDYVLWICSLFFSEYNCLKWFQYCTNYSICLVFLHECTYMKENKFQSIIKILYNVTYTHCVIFGFGVVQSLLKKSGSHLENSSKGIELSTTVTMITETILRKSFKDSTFFILILMFKCEKSYC